MKWTLEYVLCLLFQLTRAKYQAIREDITYEMSLDITYVMSLLSSLDHADVTTAQDIYWKPTTTMELLYVLVVAALPHNLMCTDI